MRKLRDLGIHGDSALSAAGPQGIESASYRHRTSQPRRGAPTNADLLGFLARTGYRAVCKRLTSRIRFAQWSLSYRLHGGEPLPLDVAGQFTEMIPPKDRFWADPFPVKRDGRYFLFIEEYIFGTGRGVISVIELDKRGTWKPPVVILETEHHLSYPFVFEWEGNYYMTPECSESSEVTLFRCRSFPLEWEAERTLLSNVRAVDPTLHQIAGTWWMFVNIAVEGANFTDELHLFYADKPHGPWMPHPKNPVKSDVRSARPAGRLFEYRGALYRPSQDSSVRPGYGIALNIIDAISPTEYVEHEASKILPNWHQSAKAIHTLNHVDGLTIVDWQRQRWRYGT